ncbi:autophagy protein 12-like [Diadema setosum]|uniref:autophagy protein 12-like n=1 Tax=Diadema setosum TaxID=31175 RepID=UPI003B3AA0CD
MAGAEASSGAGEEPTSVGVSSDAATKPVKEGEVVKKAKIDILLKATGSAPIMKKKKWAIDPSKKVAWVIDFVHKYLKCDPSQSLFLYVNQAFAPSPDQELRNLYECFGSDGKLILHYCTSEAWG